jgi:hypothetical protein
VENAVVRHGHGAKKSEMSTCFKTKFEEAEEGEGRWEY